MKNHSFTFSLFVLLLIATATLSLPIRAVGSQTTAFRSIALTGLQAPGTPSNTTFQSFILPMIDNSGQVAFRGRVQGANVNSDNQDAIWSETDTGVLRLVVRASDPVTFAEANVLIDTFDSEGTLSMSSSGKVVFEAYLHDPVSDAFCGAILTESFADGLSPVALTGGIPSIPGPAIGSVLWRPVINSVGEVALSLGSAPLGGQVWSEGGGQGLRRITSNGGPEPASGGNPRINDRGQVAFTGTIPQFVDVIWLETSPGVNRRVATEGQAAPGIMDTTIQSIHRNIGLTNSGTSLFFATLLSSELGVTNSVWAENEGHLSLMIKSGDVLPNAGLDEIFVGVNNDVGNLAFSKFGHLVANGGLNGNDVSALDNGAVLATDDNDGPIRLVAREGDPAPGTEEGTVFNVFSRVAVTSDGRGVFSAYLRGSNLDPNFDWGIWAEDLAGTLRLVVRRGGTYSSDDGTELTFTSIDWDFIDGLSEAGHIAFRASLSDSRQGIFATNLIAVPEPLTIGLAVSAIVTATIFRGRRHAHLNGWKAN